MFQPGNSATPNRRRLMLVIAAIVAVAIIAGAVLFFLRHNGGSGGPPPTPTPAPQLQGSFTKTTMTCPGQKEVAGDTCLITLHLDGVTRITVTWTGDAMIALGVRDGAGKDLGPQVTGEKGNAIFDAGTVKAGDYVLRVVDVNHPAQPFTFTVTVSGG